MNLEQVIKVVQITVAITTIGPLVIEGIIVGIRRRKRTLKCKIHNSKRIKRILI